MIIGPSQGILYAGFNEDAVTGYSRTPDGGRITAYYLHHSSITRKHIPIQPFSVIHGPYFPGWDVVVAGQQQRR